MGALVITLHLLARQLICWALILLVESLYASHHLSHFLLCKVQRRKLLIPGLFQFSPIRLAAAVHSFSFPVKI